VAELAVRVRDQMLATLREISVKVPPAHPPPAKASDDNAPPEAPTPIAETSPLPSPSLSFMSENAAPFNGAVEEGSAGVSSSGDAMSFSGSDSSPRKGNSETGTETEEEEGMIIVGRPT
jgi:lysophosphatidate acyltransferase